MLKAECTILQETLNVLSIDVRFASAPSRVGESEEQYDGGRCEAPSHLVAARQPRTSGQAIFGRQGDLAAVGILTWCLAPPCPQKLIAGKGTNSPWRGDAMVHPPVNVGRSRGVDNCQSHIAFFLLMPLEIMGL